MWDAILHAVIRRTVRRRTPNCTRAAGDEHILDLGEGSLQGEEAVRQGDGRAPGGMGGGEHRLVSPTMSLEEAGKGRRHPDPYADNRRRALGMEKSSGPASFEQRRPWLYPFCGTKKDRGKKGEAWADVAGLTGAWIWRHRGPWCAAWEAGRQWNGGERPDLASGWG